MKRKLQLTTISFIILFFSLNSINVFSQVGNPPDAPLTPQEWIDKMHIGSWWIFNIPPESDNAIKVENYSERILDSLQTLGINGGRLHWQARDMFDSERGFLLQEPIDFMHDVIDDFMERGMAICLNISFVSDFDMNENQKQRMLNGWAQLSDEFKDKSHLLAMSPVIEFHGWEEHREYRRDSLNWLYDTLTVIYRKKNPTRIMSYKPWGAASRAEFETLDYPFGNDSLPSSGEPFYYISSCSGSYGIGDWSSWNPNMHPDDLQALKDLTMNAKGNETKRWGLNSAMHHRDSTGIPFWVDHWSPNFWKQKGETFPTQWTMEQNLAYIDFFIDTLHAIGSAGAGIQTNRFWNDVTDDFHRLPSIDDEVLFSVEVINHLRERHKKSEAEKPLSINIDASIDGSDWTVYPNPIKNYTFLETKYNLSISDLHIYNLSGQNMTSQVAIRELSFGLYHLDWSKLNQGVYFIKTGDFKTKIYKQ